MLRKDPLALEVSKIQHEISNHNCLSKLQQIKKKLGQDMISYICD